MLEAPLRSFRWWIGEDKVVIADRVPLEWKQDNFCSGYIIQDVI